MSKSVFENKHYHIVVSAIPYGEAAGTPCYAVVNKDTKVVESFTYSLPDAMFVAERYSKMLTDGVKSIDLSAFDLEHDDSLPPIN